MGTTTTPEEWPPDGQFPFDLFISKKYKYFWDVGNIQFTDSVGNLFFRVDRGQPPDSLARNTQSQKLILDASDNTLIRLVRLVKGSWQGFMVGDTEEKELLFSVNRTLNTFTKLEFDIFLGDKHGEGAAADLKMTGSALRRSCTIYKGNSIVAETSLMYTLGFRKYFIPRNRFRVTIFPGFAELSLVVALVVIFFDKRKFWV
ncbi:protein LURP-one-related 7 [Lycium ferocissimum]|uniref:protein LURP-one-related 7 n=1 Tax=Lycium ferocissimum TaxID=112874 RepID=UPI002814B80C|nr:protein LURP-one-related 7 [Lycium ferocissimum]